MRTEKISEYVAHYILKHGYPRTTEDLRTAIKTTSQAVLVDALDWLATDGRLEREAKERQDSPRVHASQRVVDEREAFRQATPFPAQRAAIQAAITAIEAVIDACDGETLDTTLDSLVTYIHARQATIRAQRALLGESQLDDQRAHLPE